MLKKTSGLKRAIRGLDLENIFKLSCNIKQIYNNIMDKNKSVSNLKEFNLAMQLIVLLFLKYKLKLAYLERPNIIMLKKKVKN